jgi:hypothetical protein
MTIDQKFDATCRKLDAALVQIKEVRVHIEEVRDDIGRTTRHVWIAALVVMAVMVTVFLLETLDIRLKF